MMSSPLLLLFQAVEGYAKSHTNLDEEISLNGMKQVLKSSSGAVYEKAEKDFVAAGTAFFESHPNMGAMVLECTGFPPFARALQREIDIPVFSWGTLLDFAFGVTVHRDYYGHI